MVLVRTIKRIKYVFVDPDVDPTSTFIFLLEIEPIEKNRPKSKKIDLIEPSLKYILVPPAFFFFNQSGPFTVSESVELDVEPPYVRLGY